MQRWLWQRASALVLLTSLLAIAVLQHGAPGLAGWQALFRHGPMRGLVLLAASAMLAHAWIGLRDVAADYFPDRSWRRVFLSFWAVWLLFGLLWLLRVLRVLAWP